MSTKSKVLRGRDAGLGKLIFVICSFFRHKTSRSVPISRGVQIRAIDTVIPHTPAALAKMNKTVAIAMLPPDPMNSLTDASFTYHLDKYSCMKGMYEAHRKCASKSEYHMRKHVFGAFPDTHVCTSAVVFSDLVGICGLMCIITRMVPQIKWMHKWFGKGYIITMLWASGTSLLIHNTGV
jgi:hypothetical protein